MPLSTTSRLWPTARTLFEDDAESGDANWVYADALAAQQRYHPLHPKLLLAVAQRNDNGGYDSSLGDARWRFGPANTGLLVWYNNNAYNDNEIWHYVFDYPSVGPKGLMLVVDSHPEPYRDPDIVALGYDNEGATILLVGKCATHRSPWRTPWILTTPIRTVRSPMSTATRAGRRSAPSTTRWATTPGRNSSAVVRPTQRPSSAGRPVNWDASAVVPSTADYALKAPGYTGGEQFRYNCAPYLSGDFAGFLGCYLSTGLGYDGGTGNPGDSIAQYGWHVELIDEAADHTWATVRIWNSMYELDDEFTAVPSKAKMGDQIDYTYALHQNIGSPVYALVYVPLDTTLVEYVPGSVTNGAMPLPEGMPAEQVAAALAEGGKQAVEALAASQSGEVGGIAWVGEELATGDVHRHFGYSVKVLVQVPATLEASAMIYNKSTLFQTTDANPVRIWGMNYLPVIMK